VHPAPTRSRMGKLYILLMGSWDVNMICVVVVLSRITTTGVLSLNDFVNGDSRIRVQAMCAVTCLSLPTH
jgi:hypothetical protein